MKHDQFVGQVQARAHLPSNGDAERVIRATLETLGERLEPGLADNIAAQLPHEIAHHLLRTGPSFERLSLSDFFHRVCEREEYAICERDLPGSKLPDATFHARVVMEVLQEALTPGAVRKLRAELPREYQPLLDSGSKGPLRKGDEERREQSH
jgi:uncharacterized protein (DUF2267 family)